MKNEKSKLEYICPLLSDRVLSSFMSIPEIEKSSINELRLRLGRALACTVYSKEYFITPGGRLTNDKSEGLAVTSEDIKITFERAFESSLHSYHKELTQGYITTRGGNRVGFCGTAVLSPDRQGRVENIKNISSINIRIAREVIGCSDELYGKTLAQGPVSLIIGGPPSSGKTTILRDLCRRCGEDYRVSVIDERGELSSSKDGIPSNDLGEKSDIFLSYGKYDAIMTAVKVMSPQIIICDEIGSEDDLRALRYAVNSGVRLIATAHCSDFDELKKRPVVTKLIKAGAFDCAAILSGGLIAGKIKGIYKL